MISSVSSANLHLRIQPFATGIAKRRNDGDGEELGCHCRTVDFHTSMKQNQHQSLFGMAGCRHTLACSLCRGEGQSNLARGFRTDALKSSNRRSRSRCLALCLRRRCQTRSVLTTYEQHTSVEFSLGIFPSLLDPDCLVRGEGPRQHHARVVTSVPFAVVEIASSADSARAVCLNLKARVAIAEMEADVGRLGRIGSLVWQNSRLVGDDVAELPRQRLG